MSDAIIFSAWLALVVAVFAAYAVRELRNCDAGTAERRSGGHGK